VTLSLDFKVTGVTIDALDVVCAQLTRDLFAIAKFLSIEGKARRCNVGDVKQSMLLVQHYTISVNSWNR